LFELKSDVMYAGRSACYKVVREAASERPSVLVQYISLQFRFQVLLQVD
jgi:hypothetical protein